jgi:uncharacterized protein YndB with AHSA1/START domain
VIAAKPEKVYRAFLDADALARWIPPNGFTGKVHHMDAKVGGKYKASFTNFTTGRIMSFGGEYLELVPNQRLRYTDHFDDLNLKGEIQVTVDLKKVSVGTGQSYRRVYPMSFLLRLVISAGKNLLRIWSDLSSLKFQTKDWLLEEMALTN